MLRPDAGRVTIDGLLTVLSAREVRCHIGYMPAIPTVGSLRGIECLAFLAAV